MRIQSNKIKHTYNGDLRKQLESYLSNLESIFNKVKTINSDVLESISNTDVYKHIKSVQPLMNEIQELLNKREYVVVEIPLTQEEIDIITKIDKILGDNFRK